jgi:hypothetical protein
MYRGQGVLGRLKFTPAEPFVPEPSAAEVEVAIRKMKRYKAPGSDQIPAELIEAGGETLHSEIHKLIMLIWNKEELPHQWKVSTVVPIHKKGDKTDCSNYRGISLLSTSYKILSNGTVHQLFIDFKKAYDSVRREALYNIRIEFGIPRKLVGLIKMCLTFCGRI